MSWTLVLPGALVPAMWAGDVLPQARAPRLAQRLRRARWLGDEALAVPPGAALHLAALWRAFGGQGAPVTAPYAWQALSGAPPTAALWHCDPVHLQVARDDVLVAPLAAADQPIAAEAEALGALAEAAAQEHGARLLRPAPAAWFLAPDVPWQLTSTALAAARGGSVRALWPGGPDAARWRRLLNDVQMRWHDHPVNGAREARGQPTLNGLWLHGGGTWQALAQAPFAALAGDDPVLRGWLLAAGAHPAQRAATVPLAAAPAAAVPPTTAPRRGVAPTLAVREDLLAPAQLAAWGLWLEQLAALDAAADELLAQALADGGSAELWLCGARTVRRLAVRTSDRWQPWRRNALATLLRAPEDAA